MPKAPAIPGAFVNEDAVIFKSKKIILMNNDKISSDTLRNERLIWQQSSKGYELVLESFSTDKKITERQVFSFQNDFESVSWQHYVNIR